jgi:hypothetical protein
MSIMFWLWTHRVISKKKRFRVPKAGPIRSSHCVLSREDQDDEPPCISAVAFMGAGTPNLQKLLNKDAKGTPRNPKEREVMSPKR